VVAVEVGDSWVAVPDPRTRHAGRGAWVHPDPECLDLAERRRAFPRALRRVGTPELTELREFVTARRALDDRK
jgi:uncharacterized protein